MNGIVCTAIFFVNSYLLVRKHGTIIVIGVFSGPGIVPLHLIQDREFIIKGALMYTDDDFSESINLISQKRINTQSLISKIFDGIDHVPDAFQVASSEKNYFIPAHEIDHRFLCKSFHHAKSCENSY